MHDLLKEGSFQSALLARPTSRLRRGYGARGDRRSLPGRCPSLVRRRLLLSSPRCITCFAMRVHHENLEAYSNGKGLYEITDKIQTKIDRSGVRNGTATVFVQHTSCSIVIMENADPTARSDLEEFFDRLVPEDTD